MLAIVGRFRRALEEQGVEAPRIVLFGSWATGTPHPGSDIDLAVISQSFEGKGFWERLDILSAAIYEVFEPIEAIALTPEEWQTSNSPLVEFARSGEQV